MVTEKPTDSFPETLGLVQIQNTGLEEYEIGEW